MAWFRVDDGFWCHPKLERLEEEYGATTHAQAVALWVIAGSFSSRYERAELTLAKLRKLVPWSPVRAAKALAGVGLWDETETGYAFHDRDDYRPPSRRDKLSKTSEQPENNPRTTLEQPQNNLGNRPPESLKKKDTPEPEPEPEPEPIEGGVQGSYSEGGQNGPPDPPHHHLREAPPGTPPAPPSAASEVDRRRLAVAAEGAYSRAIERRGAIYDPDQRHRPAFAKVGTLAAKVGGRTGTPAEHLLSAWAERYVDGGRSRRPDWWLEKVEAWVSVDGAAPEAGSAVAVVLDLRGKLAALKAQIDEARDYEQLEKLRAERRGVAAQIRAAEGRA